MTQGLELEKVRRVPVQRVVRERGAGMSRVVRVRADESVRHFVNPHVGRAWLTREERAGRIAIVTPLTQSRADHRWYAVIRQHRQAWWIEHRAALIAGGVLAFLAALAGVLLAAWVLRYWIGGVLVLAGLLALLPARGGRMVEVLVRVWVR